MNREEVIRLAREAGFVRVVATHADGSLTTTVAPIEELERFAALVAAAEREKCIEVLLSNFDIEDEDVFNVAAAIRARGENK